MAALTQEELEACNTPKLGGAIKKLDTEFSDTNNLLNPNPKAIWVKNTGDLKIETIGGSGDKELARNADTVVTTASVKATLNIEKALIHACAAELVCFLASSYPL